MFRFRMLLVSMLLFVFCCPLVSHAEIDEATMMENAKSNYQEGGYYFSTTWLERILKNWPDTPQREEVLLMMSKAYAATGREEKALTTVRTLLKEFPRASDKLDPAVVSLVKEIEARKTGPYSSFEPVGLPATSTPAANAAVEPAPSPAASSVAEAANAAAIPPSPAPATHAEPPAAAPVVPVAAPVAVDTPAPGIAGVPVEAQAAVKAQVTTPPEAVDAKWAPAVAAAEPAPAPAEQAAEKAPVEVKAPVAVELPASPVAAVVAVDSPAAAKVEKVAEASPEDSKAASAVTYMLELGEYVGQNTLSGAKRLVRKAGLTPVVTPGPMREEKMLRIQVGQFAEREAAKKLQDKIRGIGAQQFTLVNKEGAYRVFAGSYFDRAAAVAEQKRLAGRGIKSELKQVTVSVPTVVLTAGSFSTEQSANDTLTALERLGLKGEVLAVQ